MGSKNAITHLLGRTLRHVIHNDEQCERLTNELLRLEEREASRRKKHVSSYGFPSPLSLCSSPPSLCFRHSNELNLLRLLGFIDLETNAVNHPNTIQY